MDIQNTLGKYGLPWLIKYIFVHYVFLSLGSFYKNRFQASESEDHLWRLLHLMDLYACYVAISRLLSHVDGSR